MLGMINRFTVERCAFSRLSKSFAFRYASALFLRRKKGAIAPEYVVWIILTVVVTIIVIVAFTYFRKSAGV